MFTHNKEEILNWVKDGGVFVVGSWFKDLVDVHSDIGIKTEMLDFLKKGQNRYIQNKLMHRVLSLKTDGWLNWPTLDLNP